MHSDKKQHNSIVPDLYYIEKIGKNFQTVQVLFLDEKKSEKKYFSNLWNSKKNVENQILFFYMHRKNNEHLHEKILECMDIFQKQTVQNQKIIKQPFLEAIMTDLHSEGDNPASFHLHRFFPYA